MSLRFFWIVLALLFSQFISHAQPEPNPTPIWSDNLLELNSWYPTYNLTREPAAVYLEQIATMGRGTAHDLLWNSTSNEIVILAADGVWFYDAGDINAAPRYMDIPAQRIRGSRSTLSYRFAESNLIEAFDLHTGEFTFSAPFQVSDNFDYLTTTPDGTRVINGRHAWATPFQALELWDTTHQRRITLSPAESAGAFNQTPIITSDSRFMIGLNSAIIRVWDLHDGKLTAEYTSEISETWEPASMNLHPDNKTLILTREGDPFEVWDLEQGLRINIPNPHMRQVTRIEFSEDGQMTATYDTSGQLVIWNSDMQIINDFILNPDFSRFVISSESQQIAAISDDHRLQLISTQDGNVLAATPPSIIGTIDIIDDNIISVYQDQLHIRDLSTGQILWQTTLPASAATVPRRANAANTTPPTKAATMTILPFRAMNLFNAVLLGTQNGELHAVLQLFETDEETMTYVSINLPSPHANDALITHIAGVALDQSIVENKPDLAGDNFLTIDTENLLVFWKVRTHYLLDDYESEPEYEFTPLIQRRLFADAQIEIFHIATQNGYLAAATSDGVYVWDIRQLIIDDEVLPIRHLRDPLQPRMQHLAWLDDERLAYGGKNGVVTIIALDDPSYNAQWQTGLSDVTKIAALDSLIFAGGCSEIVMGAYPPESFVYLTCLSYGFSVFYLNYDATDRDVFLTSPQVAQIQDREKAIENFFQYGDAILVDSTDGIIEVWGVPMPETPR